MSTAQITAIARREDLDEALAVVPRAKLDLVKKTVCPQGISDDEFALFIEQCNRSGLDPLLKMAFCVPRRMNIGTKDRQNWVTKHEFQPSEAGMLARADEFPDYRGCTAGAVYEKDECTIDPAEGLVSHKFKPGLRGRLLGAWGRVEREGRRPVVVWLDYDAYAESNSMWNKKGPTMIEKCSRVAALRKVYPKQFGGLHIEEERAALGQVEASDEPEAPKTQSQKLLGRLKRDAPDVAAAMIAQAPPEIQAELEAVEAETEEPEAKATEAMPFDEPEREPGDDTEDEAAEAMAEAVARDDEREERTAIGRTEADQLYGYILDTYGKRAAPNVVERLLAKYGVPALPDLAPADAREARAMIEAKAAEIAARKT